MSKASCVSDHPNKVVDQKVQAKNVYDVVQKAQHIMLRLNTQFHFLATEESYGVLSVEPKVVPISRHHTKVALESMESLHSEPFYILIRPFLIDQSACLGTQ